MSSLFDSAAFNGNLFYARRGRSEPPAGARDLFIEVAPQVRVHARLHARRGTRGVLLLFHGNGELVSEYDDAAGDFAAAGVDLAVVDYRGYGASDGEPTLRDALADAVIVLERVRAEVAPRPLVVMGRSLGSACAAELCGAPREGVVGYVLESGIADLAAMVGRRGIDVGGGFTADELAVFDPLPKLRRAKSPVLVLHGANDTLIDPREATLAHGVWGAADKTLLWVPGRGHNDVSFHPLYWASLAAFLGRVLAR